MSEPYRSVEPARTPESRTLTIWRVPPTQRAVYLGVFIVLAAVALLLAPLMCSSGAMVCRHHQGAVVCEESQSLAGTTLWAEDHVVSSVTLDRAPAKQGSRIQRWLNLCDRTCWSVSADRLDRNPAVVADEVKQLLAGARGTPVAVYQRDGNFLYAAPFVLAVCFFVWRAVRLFRRVELVFHEDLRAVEVVGQPFQVAIDDYHATRIRLLTGSLFDREEEAGSHARYALDLVLEGGKAVPVDVPGLRKPAAEALARSTDAWIKAWRGP
jgi:hypothetical protein